MESNFLAKRITSTCRSRVGQSMAHLNWKKPCFKSVGHRTQRGGKDEPREVIRVYITKDPISHWKSLHFSWRAV